jgi:hypothetical protein
MIEISVVSDYLVGVILHPISRSPHGLSILGAAVLWATLSFVPARALTLQPLSFDAVCSHAHTVVDAVCVSRERRIEPGGRLLFDYTTFRINETLKGAPAESVVVRVIALGETMAKTMGIPIFRPGDRAVLFLTRPNLDGYPYLVGIGMGCYHVTDGIVRQHMAPPTPAASGTPTASATPAASGLSLGRYISTTTVEALKEAVRSSAP